MRLLTEGQMNGRTDDGLVIPMCPAGVAGDIMQKFLKINLLPTSTKPCTGNKYFLYEI